MDTLTIVMKNQSGVNRKSNFHNLQIHFFSPGTYTGLYGEKKGGHNMEECTTSNADLDDLLFAEVDSGPSQR